MIIGGATDMESGVKILQQLRTYEPFRYGGKWIVACINDTVYAYRSMAPLRKKALAAGVDRLDVITITPTRNKIVAKMLAALMS